jgi:hypothetical protein
MRLLPILILAFTFAFPPAALGGGYAVTACFGAENASWTAWTPTGGATAYAGCPGGVLDVAQPGAGPGLMARNVVAPGAHAVRGTTAAMRFDAPAGTSITGLDFDAQVLTNPGWSVGVYDATGDRWIWCGTSCLTSGGHWIHRELRGLSSRRVAALVRCDAARCRRDARRAVVTLRNVRVHLWDGYAPVVSGVRGGLVAGDGWLRGGQGVAFDAADNAGIRLGRVELDGRALRDDARGCDFTRPRPCANGATSASFDTRAWADGAHALRLGAQDAGGNWTWVARTVRVDNTPPPEPVPSLDGGADWSPQRTRTITFPVPPGQAAPLARARVKVCVVGGACRDVASALQPARPPAAARAAITAAPRGGAQAAATPSASPGPWASVSVAAFAGPGQYAVRVALEDAAGNVGPAAPPLTMRFDDAEPGAPDVSAADRWHSGGALPLAAEGRDPVSGIRGYRVRIGGRDAMVATALPLDPLPEGRTPVEVRAVSGAGVASTAVRTLLGLDRSRPVVTAEGVPAPDGWSRAPVRIGLRARDQAGLSGVASIRWALDGGAETSSAGDEAAFEVAADGRHTVGYRALDAAGNESERHTIAVKVDRTPPETVAFEAPDPADPALVRVVVADATSGVARGRIELRRVGGDWRPLPTPRDSGRLLARVDDAALRPGAYELRAIVTDAAGNEAVGTHRTDGAPAALALPLRARTVLTLRRTGRRNRTVQARLTAGGRPLANRALSLTRRLRGRTAWRPVCARRTVIIASARTGATGARGATGEAGAACVLRTDAAGHIELRLRRGASRTLRLSFAGDALLLPARATMTVRTRARVRLRAIPRSVPAGGSVRFSGRLLGGHVPESGKLVELQARVGAAWRTFATVRTDPRGRFGHAHRFATTSGGRTFWVRLRVRREASYPYERATTRPLPVHVS